jgi:hypothetical protein
MNTLPVRQSEGFVFLKRHPAGPAGIFFLFQQEPPDSSQRCEGLVRRRRFFQRGSGMLRIFEPVGVDQRRRPI